MSIRSNSATVLLAVLALLFSALMAHPYAGGWNDGSRLATVESLVDRGTFCIDQSLYVDTSLAKNITPYAADNEILMSKGTLDKLLIDGHFYSDKSPMPAILMAVSYRIARELGLPSAAERPDLFAWLMTVLWSGGAFITALIALHFIGLRLELAEFDHVLLLVAFTFATVNVAYIQNVNNHLLMLGAVMPIFALLSKPTEESTSRDLFIVGLLAGFAYTIDQGMGPPLIGLTAIGFLFFRSPEYGFSVRMKSSVIMMLGMFPFVVAHHIVNYEIAGTIGPANANRAFFNWPGCPFNDQNMTGGWKHDSLSKALLYSADMLVGKKGFLFHNLPLLAGIVFLGRHFLIRKLIPKPLMFAVMLGVGWSVAAWLIYASASNNLAGMCCSIRWFVPLLAPGFLLLAIALKEMPALRSDVTILTIGGCALGVGMAIKGPWTMRMIPLYWFIVGGTLAIWAGYRINRAIIAERAVPISIEPMQISRAAKTDPPVKVSPSFKIVLSIGLV